MGSVVRSILAGSVAAGFAMVAAGCGNPLKGAQEAAVEKIVETSTGTEVDIGVESSASLPAGWPDIPTPKQNPVMSIGTDEGFLVSFVSSQGEAETIFQQMRDEGFKEEASFDYGDEGKMLMFSRDDISVGIMYGVDEDDQYLMSYTVSTNND